MEQENRLKRLKRIRKNIIRSLPPAEIILRASVFTRRRRCGGKGCHCAKDGGHATAYLSTTLPSGRTEQISLPPELIQQAQDWVAAYRRWWRSVERISAINRELFRKRWIK